MRRLIAVFVFLMALGAMVRAEDASDGCKALVGSYRSAHGPAKQTALQGMLRAGTEACGAAYFELLRVARPEEAPFFRNSFAAAKCETLKALPAYLMSTVEVEIEEARRVVAGRSEKDFTPAER